MFAYSICTSVAALSRTAFFWAVQHTVCYHAPLLACLICCETCFPASCATLGCKILFTRFRKHQKAGRCLTPSSTILNVKG